MTTATFPRMSRVHASIILILATTHLALVDEDTHSVFR
jgi:hypothetical protein